MREEFIIISSFQAFWRPLVDIAALLVESTALRLGTKIL